MTYGVRDVADGSPMVASATATCGITYLAYPSAESSDEETYLQVPTIMLLSLQYELGWRGGLEIGHELLVCGVDRLDHRRLG